MCKVTNNSPVWYKRGWLMSNGLYECCECRRNIPNGVDLMFHVYKRYHTSFLGEYSRCAECQEILDRAIDFAEKEYLTDSLEGGEGAEYLRQVAAEYQAKMAFVAEHGNTSWLLSNAFPRKPVTR